MAFTAIDENKIGSQPLPGRHFFIAARQHVAHGGIIVARGNAGDVIATVLAVLHVAPIEHHATAYGGLAHGMADIKTFYALGAVWQVQSLVQGQQFRTLIGRTGSTLA